MTPGTTRDVCRGSSASTSPLTGVSCSREVTTRIFVFGRRRRRRRFVGEERAFHPDKPTRREEQKLEYMDSLKRKYAAFPEISRIAR